MLFFMGKALIPKKEKVVDYHEVHVIGSVHTNPNSNNGLPPFTLNRNQFITINPPKKPNNSSVVVTQKGEEK